MEPLPVLVEENPFQLAPVEGGHEFQRFLNAVRQAPMLSAEEERDLAQRFRTREELDAAHRLVFSHLRLVLKIAREYLGYRLPLPDLVQEGTLGLMQAVKRFDPDRGARLATYASWWIRASIHEFILRSWSLVKVATTQLKRRLFFKLRQAKEGLSPLTHDEATELATRLGADTATVLEMDGRLSGADASLNQSVLEDAGELLDRVPDHRPNQEQRLLGAEKARVLGTWLKEGLEELDPRERVIIEERFIADRAVTLEELGQRFGVSRERVRQLEQRALGKMRQMLDARHGGMAFALGS